jgi:muramidase (phage lysozyme)
MAAPISANERAYLDTIRMAEGTWHGGGTKGYGTMFGGGQFDWSKGHPNQVVRSGGYASAAAGAYQFMPDTWNAVSKQLGLKDFSPESQDRAALQLIRNRGVDPTKPMSTEALAKLSPEWASLPTTSGRSYYNQPVKGQQELMRFYQGRLGAAPNPGNGAAPAPSAAGGGGGGGGVFAPPPLLSLPDMGPLIAKLGAGNGQDDAGSTALSAALAQQTAALHADNPLLRKPRQRMAGERGQRFIQALQGLLEPQG